MYVSEIDTKLFISLQSLVKQKSTLVLWWEIITVLQSISIRISGGVHQKLTLANWVERVHQKRSWGLSQLLELETHTWSQAFGSGKKKNDTTVLGWWENNSPALISPNCRSLCPDLSLADFVTLEAGFFSTILARGMNLLQSLITLVFLFRMKVFQECLIARTLGKHLCPSYKEAEVWLSSLGFALERWDAQGWNYP